MVIITHTDGSTFTAGAACDAVAVAHETGTIKSVRASSHVELSRFLELLDIVDSVFRKVTSITDLDNPRDF